jgi:hypothetical protein
MHLLNYKINIKYLSLSFGIGFFYSCFVYIYFIQIPFPARRGVAFSLLLWAALVPLAYLLLSHYLVPRLNQLSPRAHRNLLIISFLSGIFFAFVARPPDSIFLYPVHTLQINIPSGDLDRVISLEYAKTPFRDISFNEFAKVGEWQRSDTSLSFSGPGPASLTWSGRTGDTVTLIFPNSPSLADLTASWDGNLPYPVPLSSSQGKSVVEYSLDTGWTSGFFSILVVSFTIGFLFLVISLFFLGIDIKEPKPVYHNRGFWLLYSIPMIAVWVFFLLIFFPGIMSLDPIIQWQQVLHGQYADQHPLLYTLLIALVSKVYYSPASVVVSQILMISLAFAWGLAELERMGVSRKVLWLLTILCAILPVNILSAIALRKDVLYSAAILVLSIMFLKIINSRGEWLRTGGNWLGLGVCLAVISLTRINGLTVSVGSVFILLIFYVKIWRRLAAAAGVFVILLAAMYGPVYSLLKVKHVPEFSTILFLHHIAAHLQAGTILTTDEKDYLSKLAPLDRWNYDCCEDNPTQASIFPGKIVQNFDLPLLRQDIQKPARIALDLFLKNPSVDLRHNICASQLVWSLNSTCPDLILTSLKPYPDPSDPATFNRFNPNDMGFKADSKLPSLLLYAYSCLQVFSNGFLHRINYTSAIYLYLAIGCTILCAIRKKSWRFFLFLAPILIQSITLFLINASQTYRYQYGVILVGLFCVGFLFIPVKVNVFFPGNIK